MKLLFLIFSFSLSTAIAQVNSTPLEIGETLAFRSEILQEERILNIYLPYGYHPDSTKTYPVIYLLDGTIDEDFLHISGLVQFASYPWINMLPETIVVGIANIDRKRDFTFPTTITQDKVDFPTTGESEKFIQFLEKEVRPLIDSTYATSGTNTLIGQSLGGLLATEILFKNTDLFDRYVIVSPSLWWDNQSLLALETNLKFADKWIFVGVGKEGKIMERDARALHKKITKAHPKNTNIYFEFFKDCDHADVLHLAAYKAFEHSRPTE